jgi:hypothetical protein
MNPGDGDFLCVNFGGSRDLFFSMDMELSRDGAATCVEVPLDGLDAKSGPLVITLVSRGAANAVAEISDVRLEVSLDPDGDGLTTAEVQTPGTDPLLADTDGDGLTDSDEVDNRHTDPLAADTDGDGQADAAELVAGTNPLQNGSVFRVS